MNFIERLNLVSETEDAFIKWFFDHNGVIIICNIKKKVFKSNVQNSSQNIIETLSIREPEKKVMKDLILIIEFWNWSNQKEFILEFLKDFLRKRCIFLNLIAYKFEHLNLSI